MSDELKRCPFCGSEAMILYDGLDKECCVSCRNNDCEFCGDAGDDEQAVIDKWNTRPLEDALEAEIARLKRLVSAAKHGLASYAYGNQSPEFAQEILKYLEGSE